MVKADSRKLYRLDDSVIAQIVKVIQVGFLSGTDVSDHMRRLVVEPGPRSDTLVLTPEYKEHDARELDGLFEHLEALMAADTVDGKGS